MIYDVLIIGAGISGAAIARALSQYRLNVLVVDKGNDVGTGTTKANSAIAHAGYDAAPGSLKARLNKRGNDLMESLSKGLSFKFKRNGSFVVCSDKREEAALYALLDKGKENAIDGLKILSREEALICEPNLNPNFHKVLLAKSAGIVDPFGMVIGLCENAYDNGVEFLLNTMVTDIRSVDNGYCVETNRGCFYSTLVVNAAGVHGDEIHNFISKKPVTIIPRKGEYFLLDKCAGNHVHHTLFSLPGRLGKGVLVAPTVDGNLIIGPTAIDIEDKEDTGTTYEGMADIRRKVGQLVVDVPLSMVITSFAGLRAHESQDDFIIDEVEGAPGFIDCIGIESPGLVSAPAIGEYVAEMVCERLQPKCNTDFQPMRIIEKPLYEKLDDPGVNDIGSTSCCNVICRCELTSEKDIVHAIRRRLGARDLDGLKRRVRVGAGRCQGGFCTPKSMSILARELDIVMEDVSKKGGSSQILKKR